MINNCKPMYSTVQGSTSDWGQHYAHVNTNASVSFRESPVTTSEDFSVLKVIETLDGATTPLRKTADGAEIAPCGARTSTVSIYRNAASAYVDVTISAVNVPAEGELSFKV